MTLGLLPLTLDGAQIGAWVAAIAGALALGKQVFDTARKRMKESREIKGALANAPEIRKQLELGNIGDAINALNTIISSQNRHIELQTQRLRDCEDDIARGEARLEAAEAEAEGWEHKCHQLGVEKELDKARYDRQATELREEIEAQKRTFARTLAQARGHELPDEPPDQE